jgi:heme exporter protein B
MNVLLKHELKYYIKNTKQAIYTYSYYLSIILLVPFAAKLNGSAFQELAVIALWVALASAIAIGAGDLFKRDQETGRLEYYQLLPGSLEGIVAAKWLGYLLFTLAPLWAAIPLAGVLFNLSGPQMLHEAIGLSAGAIALSLIATLVAALTTGIEKASAVLSLLILPLSIPVMIFGAAYCRDVSTLWQPNLVFMLGFAVLMLPIMCLAGAYAIRASN